MKSLCIYGKAKQQECVVRIFDSFILIDFPLSVPNVRTYSISNVVTMCPNVRMPNLIYSKHSAHQYGFQHNKSTQHNLIQLTNFINKTLNEKKYAIGIFFDLKKALDVCPHSILLRKLHKLGIRGTALQWFTSYLQGRQQKVDIEEYTNICGVDVFSIRWLVTDWHINPLKHTTVYGYHI